jgi:hypothetical protein
VGNPLICGNNSKKEQCLTIPTPISLPFLLDSSQSKQTLFDARFFSLFPERGGVLILLPLLTERELMSLIILEFELVFPPFFFLSREDEN